MVDMAKFNKIKIQHIPKEKYSKTQVLYKLANSNEMEYNKTVIHEILYACIVNDRVDSMGEVSEES